MAQNNHFRQATKKVSKKQPGAARSLEDSVIEFSFSFKPRSGERCTWLHYITFAMSHSVDWATLSHVSNVGSNVIDVTQTVTTLCEVTIPETGVYYASAAVDPNTLGTNVGNANVSLALNDKDIAGSQVYFNQASGQWFIGGCSVSAIVSCNKGDKIKFRGQSGANKWQAGDRRRLDAFRIG